MADIRRDEGGFSLIETLVAIGVLCVGALGMAGIFATGMAKTASAPSQAIMTEKAVEAIESVFSARDSHTISWAQLQNVSAGGVFLDGQRSLTTDGPDGVVGTADDGPIESFVLPGLDQNINSADDVTVRLTQYTRQIQIANLSADLRSITVTIRYTSAGQTSSYSLTAYISTFA